MTKKTKKAAKKPRPKTVTAKAYGIVDARDGCLMPPRFLSMQGARDEAMDRGEHFCAARFTITYEVRR